jgi:hypothetical protein
LFSFRTRRHSAARKATRRTPWRDGPSRTRPAERPRRASVLFQIQRNDQYDAAVGLRWQFADSGFVSANALVPLDDQGRRADVIPTIEVEYAFSAPW